MQTRILISFIIIFWCHTSWAAFELTIPTEFRFPPITSLPLSSDLILVQDACIYSDNSVLRVKISASGLHDTSNNFRLEDASGTYIVYQAFITNSGATNYGVRLRPNRTRNKTAQNTSQNCSEAGTKSLMRIRIRQNSFPNNPTAGTYTDTLTLIV